MISVTNLSRSYGSTLAVDSVSFKITNGEVVGLLGHNGAGKTTIMKMITGFIEPSSGTVEVDGLVLGENTVGIKKKIGYLPENCPVWPEMRVTDYLIYQAKLHLVEEARIGPLVSEAIEKTRLTEKATARIDTLSRGYRQRVGVAQALLHKPDILILDEPTNGLDPNQILQMRELIKELAKSSTVIVSTHVLQEVQAICERVLIMRGGQLVLDSKIKDLQSENKIIFNFQPSESDVITRLSESPLVKKVEEIQNSETTSLRIEVQKSEIPALIRFLVSEGANIESIMPEKRTLETVFAEVSTEGGIQ
ncbi:MAG: ABC transporter ATP-binding protein [Burkholderiaceae bacterium]|nr:MAG: ABC transporter ATP-binding protein [Burkholderiaceae bacterium]